MGIETILTILTGRMALSRYSSRTRLPIYIQQYIKEDVFLMSTLTGFFSANLAEKTLFYHEFRRKTLILPLISRKNNQSNQDSQGGVFFDYLGLFLGCFLGKMGKRAEKLTILRGGLTILKCWAGAG